MFVSNDGNDNNTTGAAPPLEATAVRFESVSEAQPVSASQAVAMMMQSLESAQNDGHGNNNNNNNKTWYKLLHGTVSTMVESSALQLSSQQETFRRQLQALQPANDAPTNSTNSPPWQSPLKVEPDESDNDDSGEVAPRQIFQQQQEEEEPKMEENETGQEEEKETTTTPKQEEKEEPKQTESGVVAENSNDNSDIKTETQNDEIRMDAKKAKKAAKKAKRKAEKKEQKRLAKKQKKEQKKQKLKQQEEEGEGAMFLP